MRFKFFLSLTICVLFLACGEHTGLKTHRIEVDLMQPLLACEKTSDSTLLFWGTPGVKPFLLSGWSGNEKDEDGSFQWAVDQEAGFVFNAERAQPLFLHLKLKSFFRNPAGVYLNSSFVSNIVVDKNAEEFTIPLPQEDLKEGANVVQLRFSELLASPVPTDTRKLAAAAYFAAITPSRYAKVPSEPSRNIWTADTLAVRGKNVPVLDCATGGSLDLFQELDPDAVLRFGYFYNPSNFKEKDDYAEYSIALHTDGAPEKEIFHQRLTDQGLKYVELPLAPFVRKKDIYQIKFHLKKGMVFGDRETGWLQPTLFLNDSEQLSWTKDAHLETLRLANTDGNVVLIVLDAAGAKHFGCYGYRRPTTPNIDTLASQGTKFEHAYCQAVYTLASTASLMSGLLPIHHGVITTRNRLSSDVYTLAETFRDAGYSTGTFVANGNASDIFGEGQGFQEIQDVFRFKNYTGWGKDVTEAFERWLPNQKNRPFFAYLHYREPHGPYNPPEEWVQEFVDPSYQGTIGTTFESRLRINGNAPDLSQEDRHQIENLYDANLAYGDFQVGEVLAKLKHLGIYEHTIVIVTADHGEAFWEHNFQGHNAQLYQESLRIPLIIKLAQGSRAAGNRTNIVRTIDLYPTLVDLLGFSRKRLQVDGQSFAPSFLGESDDRREALSQTVVERQYCSLAHEYKYLLSPKSRLQELYDLKSDPRELLNLIEKEPVRTGYYRSRLLAVITSKQAGIHQHAAERAVIDEAASENLRALGYVDEQTPTNKSDDHPPNSEGD